LLRTFQLGFGVPFEASAPSMATLPMGLKGSYRRDRWLQGTLLGAMDVEMER